MLDFKYAVARLIQRLQGRSVAAGYIWGGP
jgi:hypothetical protein